MGQEVDSSAIIITVGKSSNTTSFNFCRNATASKFSLPPNLFGTHCPSFTAVIQDKAWRQPHPHGSRQYDNSFSQKTALEIKKFTTSVLP